jgi:hypothetical protein
VIRAGCITCRHPAMRSSLSPPLHVEILMEEFPMADKSPKKSGAKTAAAKSLKEKRADKKAKSSPKNTSA